MYRFCRTPLAAAAVLLATSVIAQPPMGAGPQGPAGPPNAAPLSLHPLTPAVYWLQGNGGNTGFIVGDKGVIVIDTTVSVAGAKELLADVAKVTPKSVNAVILTHSDGDHVNGLGAFPAGIKIIAQEDTRKRLEADVAGGHSRIPGDHLPNQAVTDREELVLDGVRIELLHWAPAHTDGDLVVYLPAQKIVFTGDIFALDQPRALIHREKAGTSEGWIASARGIVALNADRFVVGHGDVQTKASLQQRLDQVVQERDQIKALVAQGKSLAEVEAAVGDPPPGQTAPASGRPRFPPFSEVVYQELTEQK